MSNEVVDLSIHIDQDEFDLLKDNVDYGKPQDVFTILIDPDVISKFDNLKIFVKSYVEEHPDEIVNLFFELIICYLENLYVDRVKVVELIQDVLNFDIKLKNSRVVEFLTLCNSFPITNIRSLIQDLRFSTEVLIPNLGTALLTKLNVFSALEYKQSNEKNLIKYENYQLNTEDSLGYSILVVQIYNAFNDPFLEHKVAHYNDIMMKLIAFYKLDPSKVFDLIFDIYAANIIRNCTFLIKLLRESPFWPLGKEHVSDPDNLFDNLNQGGNAKAMDVIAMKLYYQDQKALSETHKVLLGILIKEGFINVGHLFHSARPFTDEEMLAVEKQYNDKVALKELATSELAMALPLDDSDDEGKKKLRKNGDLAKSRLETTAKVTPIDLKLNFKISILKACLTIGLYNESIFILTQYPYLIKCDDVVMALLNRFMELMIDKLYNETIPMTPSQLQLFQTPQLIATSWNSSLHDTAQLKPVQVTNLLTFDPLIQSQVYKKFQFFYDWEQNLPKVNDIDDLFKVSNEFMSLIGARVVENSSLFEKLCHIVSHCPDSEKRLLYYRKFIFPYISFIDDNPTLIQIAFSILQKYDIETRYNLYGEFYQSMYIRNQDVIQLRYKNLERETNRSLKRLTLQTAKSVSRKLSKLCMSSPMVVIVKILESLESYDNLISLVVDHLLPFFNEYAWDVLPMAILIRLTKPGRSPVQEDGLNERQWLQSLSSFIGKVSRHQQMNLNPILIYCLKKLNNGEINESIVLKDLLSLMTGIKPISNLTLEQIELLNSGNSMRRIAFNVLQDERLMSVQPAVRLLRELIKTNSLNEFFILLSSLSANYISITNSYQLKILTQKNDEFESILHLYTDLINEFFKYDEFMRYVLPVDQFCSVYNVKPQWGFEVWRKRLSQTIDKKEDSDVEMGEWNPVLLEIMEPIKQSLPETNWEALNIGFFVTFWQLSLYDISYRESFYDEKKESMERTIKALQSKLKLTIKDKEVPSSVLKKLEAEINTIKEILKDIPVDKEKHESHSSNVMKRLNREKDHWLLENVDLNSQLESFLDQCLLPRAIHSPFDAVFCARFIFFWHKINNKTSKVTLTILDYLMNKDIVSSLLLSFTGAQLENFGLFYGEVLRHLNTWRVELTYETETIGEGLLGMENVTFVEYQRDLFQIHQNILNNLRLSLQDQSYMTRSNSLVFLKNLLDFFPLVDQHCQDLLKSIELISQTDEREDLKLSANSLIGRIRSYSSKWVPLNEFYDMNEEELKEYTERVAVTKHKLQLAEAQRRAKIAAEEEAARKEAAEKAAILREELAKKKAQAESGNPYQSLRSQPSANKKATTETPSSTGNIKKEKSPTPSIKKESVEEPTTETSKTAATSQPTPTGPRATAKLPLVKKETEKAKEEIPEGPNLPKADKPKPKDPSPLKENPTNAKDRSRLLKEKIEEERRKNNSSSQSPDTRSQSGRFKDVTSQINNDTRNNRQNRYRDEDSKRNGRQSRYSYQDQKSNSDNSQNRGTKRRLDEDDRDRSDKKSKPSPLKPNAADSYTPPPLPPPKGPAPPSGPSAMSNSDQLSSSQSRFDPKTRSKLPPTSSRPLNKPKYPNSQDDAYNKGRQSQYRRPYRR